MPGGDHRLSRLERASRLASAQLSLAVEELGDGLVLFDRDERLVLCNQRFLEIFPALAPAMVPGARFEDIIRRGLDQGQYAAAGGREAAWLTQLWPPTARPARAPSRSRATGDGCR